jgi:hypothetical protein
MEPEEILQTIETCMESLEWIDDPLPADDNMQLIVAYLRIANAGLEAAEGMLTIANRERELWQGCVWISLQTLMNKLPGWKQSNADKIER